MMNLVCVDASLTLKLVLNEANSASAATLWEAWGQQNMMVIAPYLWGYEVTSVIRNQVHRKRFPADLGRAAFSAIHQLPIHLMQPDGLHQRACELANHFNRPAAYDAHYLALAEMANCPFWTADERLFNIVHDELNWVHLLKNRNITDQDS